MGQFSLFHKALGSAHIGFRGASLCYKIEFTLLGARYNDNVM